MGPLHTARLPLWPGRQQGNPDALFQLTSSHPCMRRKIRPSIPLNITVGACGSVQGSHTNCGMSKTWLPLEGNSLYTCIFGTGALSVHVHFGNQCAVCKRVFWNLVSCLNICILGTSALSVHM